MGTVAHLDFHYHRVGLVWYHCHSRRLTKKQGRDGHDSSSPPYFYTQKKVIYIPKYEEQRTNAVYGGEVYTIINLTPIIHRDDREERKAQIEKALYAVFSKYQQRATRRS